MHVRLVPIDAGEYPAVLSGVAERLANEAVRSGTWPADKAAALAQRHLDALLTDGVNSNRQFIFAVQVRETGERIGLIWAGVAKHDETSAIAYDIQIDQSLRCRGYGMEAAELFEEFLLRRGVRRIRAETFGHNAASQTLLRKLGYAPALISWLKELS